MSSLARTSGTCCSRWKTLWHSTSSTQRPGAVATCIRHRASSARLSTGSVVSFVPEQERIRMKPVPKNLVVGIIGCGYWGPNHIRVFSQIKGVSVAAIADSSETRLATVTEMFPQLRGYRDHRELLQNKEIDAVVV